MQGHDILYWNTRVIFPALMLQAQGCRVPRTALADVQISELIPWQQELISPRWVNSGDSK